MTSAGHGAAGRGIDHAGRRGSLVLAFGLAVVLAATAALLLLMSADEAEPYLLTVLGILAVVGVFSLFAASVGLLHVGEAEPVSSLAAAVADAVGEAVLVCDAVGRPVYGNAAYRALCQAVPSAPASALPPLDRLPAADDDTVEAIHRLTAAGQAGEPAEAEIRLSRIADPVGGPPHAYRLAVAPLRGGLERLGLHVWRLEAGPAVSQGPRQDVRPDSRQDPEIGFLDLQNAIDFLDRAPAGFFSVDAAGRVVFLNATLADWLGYDLAHFEAGMIPLGQLVRGDGVALLASLSGRPGDSRTETVDLDLVTRAGNPLPVRLLHRVTFGPDGRPDNSRTLVVSRAAGAEASESLRAAEVRFARFFNNAPVAIASLDKDGRIGRTNAPFLKLFGVLAHPVPGEERPRLADAVVERDRRGLAEALDGAVRGRVAVAPVDATLAGAGQRSVRFYVSAVQEAVQGGDRDADDEVAIVYALETTEQRALEAQFTQSQKMQAIGQLAGGVAHDFNNVLTAIIGFSDLLLASHRPTDPFFQDIMNIKQNANRAAGLVRQLLAFATRQTLRPERIVLTDVLADLTILLDRLLGEQVDLRVIHGRDLWPVMADVNQLEQVVINLAVNARDAMPEGGTLTIRTSNLPAVETKAFQGGRSFGGQPLPAADHILIEVSDTGTGMSAEVMDKIFEPFFSTKEVGKGTGLGLSTVYGIVTQSGGRITVESEVGAGTVFRIFLPRARADAGRADGERTGAGEIAAARRVRRPVSETVEAAQAQPAAADTARIEARTTEPVTPTPRESGIESPASGGGAKMPAGATATQADAEKAGADLTGSASILLVEDEEAVRAFAARALASRGYTVHQASTGAEALKVMAAASGGIDLVVSDVVMPEMDGPTLLRELRKTRPDLRIVFVSGYAEEAFARNLPENEHFSFLPKPFTLKQLATAVKAALAD